MTVTSKTTRERLFGIQRFSANQRGYTRFNSVPPYIAQWGGENSFAMSKSGIGILSSRFELSMTSSSRFRLSTSSSSKLIVINVKCQDCVIIIKAFNGADIHGAEESFQPTLVPLWLMSSHLMFSRIEIVILTVIAIKLFMVQII